ncbi:MAG: CoA transferase [Actinomyces sp.]|nr:CoA transferase [Actinomyces sp.]
MTEGPLSGVKVVELANFIAAATAGRFMADLGAEVIKIESPKGDPLRYTAPTEGRPLDMHENTTWDLENSNKKILSINTRTDEGRQALFELLDRADVLITNWREQSLVRQGLDYDTLHAKFPRLVYGIVTGYGQTGPDRDLPGFDFTAFFARGGYLGTLRQSTDRPFNVLPGAGDHNVGMNLAAGILAALFGARATGVGEKVETSLLETAVFNLGIPIQSAQYTEIGATYPIDARESDSPLICAWLTKDGRYIQTCMPNYNQYFNGFISAIGHPELADDERYFPIQNLQKNGLNTEVYDLIMASFGEKTAEEWKPILTQADIPFSVCQTCAEILEDPQVWATDSLYTQTYPTGNERTLVRLPVRFQEYGTRAPRPASVIGGDGPEVLRDVLGYDEDTVTRLQEDGTLYVWTDADKS